MPLTDDRLKTLSRGLIVMRCVSTFANDIIHANLIKPGILKDLFRDASGAEGRAPTTLLKLPGRRETVLLRQLHHGGIFSKLLGKRFLGPNRPLEELSVTNTLHVSGAPVPIPVLALAERSIGPWFHCAVASIFEENTQEALTFLREKPGPAAVNAAARAAGASIRRFHDAGGKHADLHVKNLLLRKCNDGYECVVIDLDRARVGTPPKPRRRMTELMRLLRSLYKREVFETVGIRGCVQFLSAYCRNDRALRETLLEHRVSELRRIRVHALHYRYTQSASTPK